VRPVSRGQAALQRWQSTGCSRTLRAEIPVHCDEQLVVEFYAR